MKSTTANVAWTKFLEEIAAAREALECSERSGTEAWFRGHERSDYRLLPSLFRKFADPAKGDWDAAWQTERDLYWEFSARGREAHAAADSWEILFMMQHFGTPTRLLDWTEVLGVALYFAVVDAVKKPLEERTNTPAPAVWVLNPYRLNELTYTEDADLVAPRMLGWDEKTKSYFEYDELLLEEGVDWDLPQAIYPRQSNPRIHAQRGWFTIHGDDFVPLESIPDSHRFLRKVELPWAAVEPARAFLRTAGLDHYALFPDLTNLGLSLREKYGFLPSEELTSSVPKKHPTQKRGC